MKPGSKFEVPTPSRTVEEFESGLYNVRLTCSRLYTSVRWHKSTSFYRGKMASRRVSHVSPRDYFRNRVHPRFQVHRRHWRRGVRKICSRTLVAHIGKNPASG